MGSRGENWVKMARLDGEITRLEGVLEFLERVLAFREWRTGLVEGVLADLVEETEFQEFGMSFRERRRWLREWGTAFREGATWFREPGRMGRERSAAFGERGPQVAAAEAMESELR